MRYKLLGTSGLRVSELCLGTMSFGDAWGFGADEKESLRILEAFGDAGGNFIDTANKYHEGQSEEIVGAFVGSDRDRWVIGTKYTLAMRPDDPNAAGNGRKNLRQSVESSLARLGTDHLDVLWVHAWDFTVSVEAVMRSLDDLVRSGKVLHVALSDAPAWVAAQANAVAGVRGWNPFVALQFEYNLIERSGERELIPMADALGLSVTAWAPLAGGVLTGKYTGRHDGLIDSRRVDANQGRLSERNLALARTVDRVAAELGATSAQVALAWLRTRGRNIVPIVGARTEDQLRDVLGALAVELPASAVAQLTEASAIEPGVPMNLLCSPQGQLVYGELEPAIDLPSSVPYRWGRAEPAQRS